MSGAGLHLDAPAAASLARWHEIVAAQDAARLEEIVHPEARFVSPAVFKPYEGRETLLLILQTVMGVFQDFAYHRECASADGRSVVLEFSAKVGDRMVDGIDFIAFDEAGLITEFKVMIRPLSGLQALAEEMGRRFAPLIAGRNAGSA